MSARSSPADRAAAERAGSDVFLGKPFPLDDLVAASVGSIERDRRPTTDAGSTVPTVRLLVVEDDVKMASLLKRGLEREGYAVDLAATRRGRHLGRT